MSIRWSVPLKHVGRTIMSAAFGLAMAMSSGCAGLHHDPVPRPSLMPSVVRVVTPTGRGSGFYLTRNAVATAAHVVGSATSVVVTSSDGRRVQASVIYRDKAADCAVLAVPSPGQPLKIRTTPLHDGEPIMALGYPQGRSQAAASTGTLHAIAPIVLIHDALMAGGSSGGPLVDAENRVIGVNVMIQKHVRDVSNVNDRGVAVRIHLVLQRLADTLG